MKVSTAVPAAAQAKSRPGPWVLDVRGVTSPVPTDPDYYPPLAAVLVPERGFGVDVGAHVYLFNLGPARNAFMASEGSWAGSPSAAWRSMTTV